jgi:hypothetical protein
MAPQRAARAGASPRSMRPASVSQRLGCEDHEAVAEEDGGTNRRTASGTDQIPLAVCEIGMATCSASQQPRQDQNRLDLVTKLLRFALDPSAREGEAENAACRMVRVARRENVGFEHLQKALAPARLPPPPPVKDEPPPVCELAMWCGKYEGWTLGELARHDAKYLKWVASEFNDEDVRDAAAEVLSWFFGRGRAA